MVTAPIRELFTDQYDGSKWCANAFVLRNHRGRFDRLDGFCIVARIARTGLRQPDDCPESLRRTCAFHRFETVVSNEVIDEGLAVRIQLGRN